MPQDLGTVTSDKNKLEKQTASATAAATPKAQAPREPRTSHQERTRVLGPSVYLMPRVECLKASVPDTGVRGELEGKGCL